MPEEKQSNYLPTGGAPDFNQLELGVLQVWEDNKIFEKSLEKTKGGEPFIFYDGPPFATGLPHYGSILPSVIKDAIPRYQTMKGRYVRRRWGWDCHGLPIENLVEKSLKISGKKQIEEMGVEKFNKVCRDNVLNLAHEWGKMVKRIARWVEFEDSYKTMDTSYMESVWWALKQIWDKGLIYQDRKVLLYCSRCETPISNFEVAMDNSYRDITEESVFVKFKMLKGQRIVNDLTSEKTFALAWTTTPWTLPGNTSLNAGPEIKYVMIEQTPRNHAEEKNAESRGNLTERYILAKDCLAIIEGAYEIVAEFSARDLEGLQYEPLYPGVIPNPEGTAHKIYLADFVTTTDGTGLVHNAAMYGEEDYELAKAKNLPRVDMLDNKGQYLEKAPEHLRGVFFKDADKLIIQDLKANKQLYKTESYTHSYPHCYRCATPLFYSALPAWFINIQKVKSDLIANNQDINWYPEHLKFGRFQLGVENAPDWNISRNRYWATALPFWKCQACKEAVCVGSVSELAQRSTNIQEVYPNFQFPTGELDKLELHKPFIDKVKLRCEKCGGEMFRVPEVVDCWVESGSMPFAELHAPFENQELFKARFPSDFVVEYIPQTRAWFYVMHVISTILFGRAPFKNVLTTGTILGEDGTKMSKSKGNYPDPNTVIEKYGADALRFYLLTSPVVTGEDVNFSEKGVQEVGRKVGLLFYNVWSFYRMYKPSRNHTEEKIAESRGNILSSPHVLDKWIVARLGKAQEEITKHMDTYNTVKAGREIIDFIDDLSTWYLRRSRDRIKGNDAGAKPALQTLGLVLSETAKLLAPFMPFLSDFIFRDVTGKESVHLENWSEPEASAPVVLEQMGIVREVVSLGQALRKAHSLSVRKPLRAAAFDLGSADLQITPELSSLILEELNIKIIDASLIGPKAALGMEPATLSGTGKVKQFYLDIHRDEALIKEGWARELERLAQDLRKKSGLKVGELVDLYYNTQDLELEQVLLTQVDRKKTFIVQIAKHAEVEPDFEAQGEVEGRVIWLGVVKIVN